MKQRKKFEQQEEQIASQQIQQQSAQEFATVEDMLRFDAARTAVPGSVAKRLQQSTQNLPAPSRSWWRRFFGGNP